MTRARHTLQGLVPTIIRELHRGGTGQPHAAHERAAARPEHDRSPSAP